MTDWTKKREEWHNNKETIGYFIKRYWIFYMILLGLISVFELVMIVRALVRAASIPDYFEKTSRLLYFISYIVFMIASALAALTIGMVKKKHGKHIWLFNMLHIYSVIAIIWATFISCLDMAGGSYPIVYLTIVVVLAGIVVLDPAFYSIIVCLSAAGLFIFGYTIDYEGFSSGGALINILVFVIMAVFIAFKHYKVNISEARSRSNLRNMTRTDYLTGLGNETLYFETIDQLNTDEDKASLNYLVLVMDLNGLKATNDKYGHRFGCHLVVETGHILPTIFKTSKLFHIGGDEFVAIVSGEDYDKIDERMTDFDKKLEYTEEIFEEKPLILSVAKGMAVHKRGMRYQDVFQEADDAMYRNKVKMKEMHNIASR